MSDPFTLTGNGIDLAQKAVSLLSLLKGKLGRDKNAALAKLACVLQEISKTYFAFNDELVGFISMNPEDVSETRSILYSLGSGQLYVRVNEAAGHCHKIKNIYEAYIKKWFDALAVKLKIDIKPYHDLFDELGDMDKSVVEDMRNLNDWLSVQAAAVLACLDRNDPEKAGECIISARRKIQPFQQAMARTVAQLLQLQAEYIELSGAV